MSKSREEKIKDWEWAINMNQIDGPWKPSYEFKKLIQREIDGEITTQEMIEILKLQYTRKD